jgi:hypothetical protein
LQVDNLSKGAFLDKEAREYVGKKVYNTATKFAQHITCWVRLPSTPLAY